MLAFLPLLFSRTAAILTSLINFIRVAWAGAVACAVCVVLVSIIVIARDVLKVFDCCGVTKGAMAAGPPMRILTTMSAGYAAGNNGK
eukprot:2823512-Rhodomonas_salina.1